MRAAAFGAMAVLALGAPAHAGIAGEPHGAVIRFCFVGNAMSAKPDDVKFIMDNMKIFENVAHIRYEMMGNGVCPPPTLSRDGKFEVHAGDMRIAVAGTLDYDGKTPITGLALGKGCGDPGTTGWWGNFPVNLNKPQFRACRMNSFLRKPMRLNKIMHEIGHTLGLPHEHERDDIAAIKEAMVQTCHRDVRYFGRGASNRPESAFVTPYDRDSVMHYEINTRIDPKNVPAGSTCNLGNDNGSTGLSTWDRLTLRMMYPHGKKVAEYIGTTVVRTGARLQLRNEWGVLGALTQNALKSPQWTLRKANAVVAIQNLPDFDFAIPAAGDYTLTYTFRDFRDRTFTNTIPVRVLPPADFNRTIGATAAAQAALN